MIYLDLEIGDTILTGKFRNKKVIVKDVGINERGEPTVNGKSILNIRIPKLYIKENKIKKLKLANLLKEETLKNITNNKIFKYLMDITNEVRLEGEIPKKIGNLYRYSVNEYEFYVDRYNKSLGMPYSNSKFYATDDNLKSILSYL